jgi:5-dehydro-4-deoxyglucarate dehydratase
MGVTTYSSAVFNFVPEFATAFYAVVRRRDHAVIDAGLRNFILPLIAIRNRKKGYAVSIIKAGMKVIGRDSGPVRSPSERERDRGSRRAGCQLARYHCA